MGKKHHKEWQKEPLASFSGSVGLRNISGGREEGVPNSASRGLGANCQRVLLGEEKESSPKFLFHEKYSMRGRRRERREALVNESSGERQYTSGTLLGRFGR